MKYALISLFIAFAANAGQPKIYNGEVVSASDYRQVVALTFNSNSFCTGTLIDNQTVVTAAHCVTAIKLRTRDISAYRVYIGAGESGGRFQGQYEIKSSWIHPHYRISSGHDVAILRLKSKVTETIESAVILEKLVEDKILRNSKKLEIVGFGLDENNTKGIKKKVSTEVRQISNFEFMTGGEFKRDSCNGDSGGPIFTTIEGRFVLLGVVSRAAEYGVEKCGDGGVYGKASIAMEVIDIARKYERALELYGNNLNEEALKIIDEVLQVSSREVDALALKDQILKKLQLTDEKWNIDLLAKEILNNFYYYSRHNYREAYFRKKIERVLNSDFVDESLKMEVSFNHFNRNLKWKNFETTYLEKLIELKPENIFFLEWLVDLEIGKMNYASAKVAVEKLKKLNPDNEDVLKLELHILNNLNDDKAVALAQNLKAQNSRGAEVYFVLAKNDIKQHDYVNALSNLVRAVTFNPFYADAYKLKLEVEKKLGLDFVTTEARVNFHLKMEYLVSADSLLNKDEFALAHAEINKALEIDQNYADAYSMRAKVYHEEEKFSQAIENYLISFNLEYSDMTLFDIIYTYSFIENSDAKALEFLNKQIALHPMIDTLYETRVELHSKLGNYELAFEDAKKFYELSHSDYFYRRLLFTIHDAMGNYDLALEEIISLIKLKPSESYLYYRKSSLHEKLNQIEEAIEAMDISIAYEPDPVYKYERKAALLEKLERYQEAILVLSGIIALNPKEYPYLYFSRSELYKKIGEIELAAKDYQTYLDLSKN